MVYFGIWITSGNISLYILSKSFYRNDLGIPLSLDGILLYRNMILVVIKYNSPFLLLAYL